MKILYDKIPLTHWKAGGPIPDDAGYSIAERIAFRRAAETSMAALGIPIGQVTRMEAQSSLELLSLFHDISIPLSAECYDLSSFVISDLKHTKPNLLRLVDPEGDQRVLEIAAGLVLFFPETVGQAPVIYLQSNERPPVANLYQVEHNLEEWSRPVCCYQALLGKEKLIFESAEVIAHKLAEMEGEVEPLPELLTFTTAGIALGIHVAPRQFNYRFPEFALTRIAHWSLDELQEILQETMNMMIEAKQQQER